MAVVAQGGSPTCSTATAPARRRRDRGAHGRRRLRARVTGRAAAARPPDLPDHHGPGLRRPAGAVDRFAKRPGSRGHGHPGHRPGRGALREPRPGITLLAANPGVARPARDPLSGGSRPSTPAGRSGRPSAGAWRTSWPARAAERVGDHHVAAFTSSRSGGSGSCRAPSSSLRSAEASASGSPVRLAPSSSASYSRVRLIAICIRPRRSGRGSAARSSRSGSAGPRRRRRRRTARSWAIKVMMLASAGATDEVRMSRLYTCMSSCPSTPRSSRSSRICRMPSVQQTAAFARVAAGGEGVGRVRRRDVQPRHRLAGLRWTARARSGTSPAVGLADRAGPHRPERELVGVPVAVGVDPQRDDQRDHQRRSRRKQPPISRIRPTCRPAARRSSAR